MKLARIALACLAIAALTGCQTFQKLDSQIPDGKWDQAEVEVTGKFTSTKLEATGTKVNGEWVDGELHFSHTNPWVTKATIDLKKSAK